MAILRQLADPAGYRPCAWDLKADAAARTYWVELFRWHLDRVLMPLVTEVYSPTPAQVDAMRADYLARFDEVERQPERFERLDVLRFTELRRDVLARHRFDDPFRGVKERANAAALAVWPQLRAEFDAAPPRRQQDLLTRGLMAGNLFDLGSRATVASEAEANAEFLRTRDRQPPRPWFRDDVDRWWRRWDDRPYRRAVCFVDNAGGDIVLGCLPLARWMLARGARVTLAANAGPALNDITAAELTPLLARCAEPDPRLASALRDGRLRVAATGSTTPLLDLTDLNGDFVELAADADLIHLHGMGRGIESNFHVPFTCDTLTTAVLKDEAVAAHVGGRVFDCVFRFEPAR